MWEQVLGCRFIIVVLFVFGCPRCLTCGSVGGVIGGVDIQDWLSFSPSVSSPLGIRPPGDPWMWSGRSCALSVVLVSLQVFLLLLDLAPHSACHPPCEQLLAGMGVGTGLSVVVVGQWVVSLVVIFFIVGACRCPPVLPTLETGGGSALSALCSIVVQSCVKGVG